MTYDHGNNSGNSNPLIAHRGNGNVIDDGVRTYAYDALNRLVSVAAHERRPDGRTVRLRCPGRRIQKTVSNGGVTSSVPNGTTRFLYDGASR